MAFTIAQAGSSFHILDGDGDLYTTLTLPTGVTVDPDVRAQFLTLGQRLIITRAPSINLWVDPADFSVRPLGTLPPVAPPVIAAGSGTGLTGTYYASYSYIVVIDGIVVQESPRSPNSLPITLANDDIDWSNLVPSNEAHVNGYRLYRTVADGSAAVMFEAHQLGGNSQTAFAGDDSTDAALSLLAAPDAGNPPGGTIPGTRLQVTEVWRERLWAVSSDPTMRDTVAYSEIGNPFVWRTQSRLPIPSEGEDEWGVTGFLPRRDELVVCRRRRFCKILGYTADNFEVLILAEGPSCVSPDSCIVVDDIGYCRGLSAVYEVGSEGVRDITVGKVGAWFHTDALFARSDAQIQRTMASYNPVTDTIDMHMVTGETVAQTEFSVWLSWSRALREWIGPGLTAAVTCTARGTRRNSAGEIVPVIGGSDGRLYNLNGDDPYDTTGAGVQTGIMIDWRTVPYLGMTPSGFHLWGRPVIYQRAQGSDAVSPDNDVTVWIFVGEIREQGQSILNPTKQVRLPLSRTKVELPRAGWGQALQMYFQHNFLYSTTTGAQTGTGASLFDFELWGLELPIQLAGRRG